MKQSGDRGTAALSADQPHPHRVSNILTEWFQGSGSERRSFDSK